MPNYFADKFGVLNVLTLVSFGTGAMVFALFGVSTASGVVVFSILYGFFSGGCEYSYTGSFYTTIPELRMLSFFLVGL